MLKKTYQSTNEPITEGLGQQVRFNEKRAKGRIWGNFQKLKMETKNGLDLDFRSTVADAPVADTADRDKGCS